MGQYFIEKQECSTDIRARISEILVNSAMSWTSDRELGELVKHHGVL